MWRRRRRWRQQSSHVDRDEVGWCAVTHRPVDQLNSMFWAAFKQRSDSHAYEDSVDSKAVVVGRILAMETLNRARAGRRSIRMCLNWRWSKKANRPNAISSLSTPKTVHILRHQWSPVVRASSAIVIDSLWIRTRLPCPVHSGHNRCFRLTISQLFQSPSQSKTDACVRERESPSRPSKMHHLCRQTVKIGKSNRTQSKRGEMWAKLASVSLMPGTCTSKSPNYAGREIRAHPSIFF